MFKKGDKVRFTEHAVSLLTTSKVRYPWTRLEINEVDIYVVSRVDGNGDTYLTYDKNNIPKNDIRHVFWLPNWLVPAMSPFQARLRAIADAI